MCKQASIFPLFDLSVSIYLPTYLPTYLGSDAFAMRTCCRLLISV